MTKRPHLSVVIPAYNEVESIKAGKLDGPYNYLSKQKYSFEILLVDDGSTDDTLNLLKKYANLKKNVRVYSIEHGGKSAAVSYGVLKSEGEIVLFTDFDQSTPIDQVDKFLHAHSGGADVVIGVRGAGSTIKQDTWIRRLRSWIFVSWVKLVLLPNISDSQCGFKSFTHESANRIFPKLLVCRPKHKISGGYMGAFDAEVLFLAQKFSYRIDQVPVNWIKYPSDRLNIWKEPMMMVVDTLKVRVFDMLKRYEKKS